eukprot:6110959-Prymnesium_polylepis.2
MTFLVGFYGRQVDGLRRGVARPSDVVDKHEIVQRDHDTLRVAVQRGRRECHLTACTLEAEAAQRVAHRVTVRRVRHGLRGQDERGGGIELVRGNVGRRGREDGFIDRKE